MVNGRPVAEAPRGAVGTTSGPRVLEETARTTLAVLQASHGKLDIMTNQSTADGPSPDFAGLTEVLQAVEASATSLDERVADIVGRIGRL